MRIVAILAAYNEERFIASCIDHYIKNGVEVYLIDNCSTDSTVEIAEHYRGRGLINIENMPRDGIFRWHELLSRKAELAETINADWFIHADPDEVRLSPDPDKTLAQAIAEVDAQGYNAVNFMEFTFMPVQESQDHDHPDFQKTMLWYYPFLPRPLHQLKAWKKQPVKVELSWLGGHKVRFTGLRMYPKPFPMRHYLFLSHHHAVEKYVERRYDSALVKRGWHGWRARLKPEMIQLPRKSELRTYFSDSRLDPSNPWKKHFLDEQFSLTAAVRNKKKSEKSMISTVNFFRKIQDMMR